MLFFSGWLHILLHILLNISVAKIDQLNKHHRIHNSFPQDNEEKNTTSRLGMDAQAGVLFIGRRTSQDFMACD